MWKYTHMGGPGVAGPSALFDAAEGLGRWEVWTAKDRTLEAITGLERQRDLGLNVPP